MLAGKVFRVRDNEHRTLKAEPLNASVEAG